MKDYITPAMLILIMVIAILTVIYENRQPESKPDRLERRAVELVEVIEP